jgi:hypothetical protein
MGSREQKRKKKGGDDDDKHAFEPGRVFSPKKAKEEDLSEDMESATYKAQKGQGGDRRT